MALIKYFAFSLILTFTVVGTYNLCLLEPSSPRGIWYVVLFFDTKDPWAGGSLTKLSSYVEKAIEPIANALNFKLELHAVQGNNFNKKEIQSTIQYLSRLPNIPQQVQMVTVFSSSHGFNNLQSILPTIGRYSPSGNMEDFLPVEAIYDSLRANPAFNYVHVFSEACNTLPSTQPYSYQYLDTARLSQGYTQGLSIKLLEKIFLSEPSWIFSSSKFKEDSYSGAFTMSYLEAFNQIKSNQIKSEDEFFNYIQKHTQLYANSFAQVDDYNPEPCASQTAVLYRGDVPSLSQSWHTALFIVCDASNSMTDQEVAGVNDAINSLFNTIASDNTLRTRLRVSVLSFSDQCQVLYPPNFINSPKSCPQIELYTTSNMTAGLYVTDSLITQLPPSSLKPIVVLLSDGRPDALQGNMPEEKDSLMRLGNILSCRSHFYTVGMSQDADTTFLKTLSGEGQSISITGEYLHYQKTNLKQVLNKFPTHIIPYINLNLQNKDTSFVHFSLKN